jgi:cytochrome c oxidase assembly protein subunit 15
LILVLLLWLGLSLSNIKRHPSRPLFLHALAALVFVTVTIFWGAFTAGLDAGLVYNDTFPKMGGQWIPPDYRAGDSLLANILENHSMVQFTHRWLAITTALVICSLWLHGFLKKQSFGTLHALMVMVLVQIALGITTLFTNVNIHVAATHQAGAVIVLCLLISVLFQSRTSSSKK